MDFEKLKHLALFEIQQDPPYRVDIMSNGEKREDAVSIEGTEIASGLVDKIVSTSLKGVNLIRAGRLRACLQKDNKTQPMNDWSGEDVSGVQKDNKRFWKLTKDWSEGPIFREPA